jgi:hypothetical protein
MKVLFKVLRVVFFPIFWMKNIEQELKIIKELLARKSIVDVGNTAYDEKTKVMIAKNVINVSNGLFEEDS